MPKILLVLLLGLLSTPARAIPFTHDSPACPVYFVQPVRGADGQTAEFQRHGMAYVSLREMKRGEHAPTDRVRDYLEKSPAFALVRQLYAFSWQRAGKAGEGALVMCTTEIFGSRGPMHTEDPAVVTRLDGSELEVSSFVILSDLHAPPAGMSGPDLTLAVLMEQDYLGLVMAHEAGHQMLHDRYPTRQSPRWRALTRKGHDAGAITDPSLAFNEGWAEGVEAIVGDWLSQVGAQPRTMNMSLRRLVEARGTIIEKDRYIFADHNTKDGHVRNGLQLMCTEGVVAYLVYMSYTNRVFLPRAAPGADPIRRDDPRAQLAAFGKTLDLVFQYKPLQVLEFWQGAISEMPQARPALIRIFLEGTKYATVDPTGPARYREFFEARQRLVKGAHTPDERRDLKRENAELESRYTTWKEALYEAAATSNRLDSALPPGLDGLWVDHGILRVGLNLASADEIGQFLQAFAGDGADDQARAQAIVDARDGKGGRGFFADVAALGNAVPPALLAKLHDSREEFKQKLDAGTANPQAAHFTPQTDFALMERIAAALRHPGQP